LKDEVEDNNGNLSRENLTLSRRSSLGKGLKKGSMQSLIVESLKFLNDDTDVVPAKREPLFSTQVYKTNPPSEMFNVATPAYSHLGGYDDDLWNNTIFSQNEYRAYQRTVGPIDEKSCFSH